MGTWDFRGRLRRWPGAAAWYFVALPDEVADDVRSRRERVGFGSVRVRVTLGATTWGTSVFPDSASGSYLLPVKAAVRRAEDLDDGSEVRVRLELA
ncbi:MAG: DUF1905 domain-containing protein [Frankiales bacterium]|nr:DUF1905 domain-containing protein [Frankiales bacterium]